jgi:predicted nucleic acid-binding protein
MLGLARIQLDGFLKSQGIYQEYTHYLIQIGYIELLPRIFEKVALPVAVEGELSDPLAPLPVRRWIATSPAWLDIHDTIGLPQVPGLDAWETAAMALARPRRAGSRR